MQGVAVYKINKTHHQKNTNTPTSKTPPPHHHKESAFLERTLRGRFRELKNGIWEACTCRTGFCLRNLMRWVQFESGGRAHLISLVVFPFPINWQSFPQCAQTCVCVCKLYRCMSSNILNCFDVFTCAMLCRIICLWHIKLSRLSPSGFDMTQTYRNHLEGI